MFIYAKRPFVLCVITLGLFNDNHSKYLTSRQAQLIAQTIGQAFALAYLEFLKVNGIDDAHVQEMDYHDVLNSQEIYGDDLMLFSNKECEKEVRSKHDVVKSGPGVRGRRGVGDLKYII